MRQWQRWASAWGVSVLGVFTAQQASAAGYPEPPAAAVQAARAAQVVAQYAQSIGCVDQVPAAQDVVVLRPYTSAMDRMDAQFVASWVGDIGCQGGTGTTQSYVAVVKIGAADTFYVDVSASQPQISTALPRYITRLVQGKGQQLVVEALDYASQDRNCCPTLHQRITLEQDHNGNWQRTQTQVLEPRVYD